jgi:hypothetical protein
LLSTLLCNQDLILLHKYSANPCLCNPPSFLLPTNPRFLL